MLFVVVQGRPNLQLFNHLYWLLFSAIFVLCVRIHVVQGRPNLQLFNHLYWLLFSTIFVLLVRIQMNWLKYYPPQIINRKRKHQEFRKNNQNLQMIFWLQVICQPIMKYLRGSFSGGCQYVIVIRVAQIVAAWLQKNGERMRKLRGKGEQMRKWRGNEEMERVALSTFPHFLVISSLSFHFLYQKLSHFVAKR